MNFEMIKVQPGGCTFLLLLYLQYNSYFLPLIKRQKRESSGIKKEGLN